MFTKLIIFDLDGTLVDAYKAVSLSLNGALTQFGYKSLTERTVKRSVGWGERNLVERFVPEDKVERVLKSYRAHHKEALKKGTKFLPGAKILLKFLKKQGYVLAIASNRPTKFTNIILRHLGVRPLFRYVLCADKVKNPKPAGDLLLTIIRKAGLKRSEALYVGDMAIDIEAGHNAGIKTVVVTTGSSTRKELAAQKPLAVINHIGKVGQFLEK